MELSYIKNFFSSYFNESLKNKKYLVLYALFVLVTALSMLSLNNYYNPKFEIIIFLLVLFIGIFLINFYTKHTKELHKVAFLVIICFGICSVLLTPILDVCDEQEHFTRAELTSKGDFFPQNNENGFKTIQGTLDLIGNSESTIFETDVDTKSINHTTVNVSSVFQQNPFFGYLASGIGVFLAKLLDLNLIWMLWIGRFFNILLYATLVSVAVKKSPILKIPLIIMAAIPSAVYQGASMSIDAVIFGVGIVVVAYFFNMIKSKDFSVGKKELAIFSSLCIILGLCKLPFLAFIFLLILVPKNKFSVNKYLYGLLCIIIVSIIGLIWSSYYAIPSLTNSYRMEYYIVNNVSASGQINYILSNIPESIVLISDLPNYLTSITENTFYFSYEGNNYGSKFIDSIYPMFIGGICLLYPY
ncbi:DUF2142 domain-containing protein, partial [Methanobrevibacter sp. OttesenSCG-928-K11]|nr:DUF2142 domain-containing protein [Methanobrevibacter sp. OttesenSCG-928-K11]